MPARLLAHALRRPYLPFLGFALAAQAALAWPWSMVQRPGWALVALIMFALTCLLAVGTRRPGLSNLAVLAPLLFLVVLALWRHADAGAPAGFEVIALLPIAWSALFGTMRQVLITVAAFAIMLMVPVWLVGAPDYPHAGLRAAVITTVFAALIAPTAQYLVRELDAESARLDAVLRAATGHSVVACDLDGVITMFNPGAERMLGWRASEALGQYLPELLHDGHELAERADELGVGPGLAVLTHAVTAAGGSETRDWTYVTRGGQRLTVSLAMTGMRNADGHLIGYMGVATDVTAARRTVRSLENQREVNRLLIDHLPMTTVGVYDAQLRCMTIGGHWLLTHGIDAESLSGKHIGEFFHEDDREAGVAMYSAGLAEPQLVDLELATGPIYRFEVLPIEGPSGERYVLSVARDISERHHTDLEREAMHKALAVSEASFREAFDGAPIGIALTTVEDGPDERFLRVNSAFAGMLGRDAADFVDVPVAEFTHPEDMTAQPDLTSSGVGATRLRKRFLHASGRAVWVEISYAVVQGRDGTASHVIKHIQDIRAIKESERALLEALEQQRTATATLRELDQMRRDVVGTISHELRTPLTSIHGYLELLAEEQLTPQQQQMIAVAIRNSGRLAGLVDNLLVLARLEAADTATVLFNTDVGVQDIARAAIDTVRPEISDRGQHLVTRFAATPVTVKGDAEQLHRALLNLLSNASKYTPDGGTIEVDVDVQPDRVSMSIGDSGIGIPVDEQPHLFERFFRASTARDQSIGGNGLGLAIVKSIVELHDGHITVESEPDHGSRFTIDLPTHAAASAGVVRAS